MKGKNNHNKNRRNSQPTTTTTRPKTPPAEHGASAPPTPRNSDSNQTIKPPVEDIAAGFEYQHNGEQHDIDRQVEILNIAGIAIKEKADLVERLKQNQSTNIPPIIKSDAELLNSPGPIPPLQPTGQTTYEIAGTVNPQLTESIFEQFENQMQAANLTLEHEFEPDYTQTSNLSQTLSGFTGIHDMDNLFQSNEDLKTPDCDEISDGQEEVESTDEESDQEGLAQQGPSKRRISFSEEEQAAQVCIKIGDRLEFIEKELLSHIKFQKIHEEVTHANEKKQEKYFDSVLDKLKYIEKRLDNIETALQEEIRSHGAALDIMKNEMQHQVARTNKIEDKLAEILEVLYKKIPTPPTSVGQKQEQGKPTPAPNDWKRVEVKRYSRDVMYYKKLVDGMRERMIAAHVVGPTNDKIIAEMVASKTAEKMESLVALLGFGLPDSCQLQVLHALNLDDHPSITAFMVELVKMKTTADFSKRAGSVKSVSAAPPSGSGSKGYKLFGGKKSFFH